MGWTKTKGKVQHDFLSDENQAALDDFFPGALKGKAAELHVASHLMKNGFEEDNTLFCDSSCPDEINHDDPSEDITMIFQQRWGGVFPLGGLAGLPFTGKTGWNAFSSHIPKDGNIVILFAPHVGIDSSGLIGKVQRDGQDASSSACGAAIGALAAMKSGIKETEFKNGMHDHQMDCIKHLLEPHVDELAASKNEQVALAYKMYEILEEFLESIIHTNWMSGRGSLAIVGGIMINCDGVGTDRFLPLKFELRTLGRTVDLFEDAFGKRPINPYMSHSKSTIEDVRRSIESLYSRDVREEWDRSK